MTQYDITYMLDMARILAYAYGGPILKWTFSVTSVRVIFFDFRLL
jgi:hypothetical protein